MRTMSGTWWASVLTCLCQVLGDYQLWHVCVRYLMSVSFDMWLWQGLGECQLWHVTVSGIWRVSTLTCDCVSYLVSVSFDMSVSGTWRVSTLTCDCVSYLVSVIFGMWLCQVLGECQLWHVTVSGTWWVSALTCDSSVILPVMSSYTSSFLFLLRVFKFDTIFCLKLVLTDQILLTKSQHWYNITISQVLFI